MSDAVLFVLVFGGLFVLRGVAATVVFLWILPDGIRCPQCDAETLRMEPGRVLRLLRSFRASWCLVCGWRGVHRMTSTTATMKPRDASRSASAPPARQP